MEILNTHITIGSYSFDFVNKFVVDSSWKKLTDTAEITLPAKLKFDRGNLRDSVKPGDPVVIKSGYFPNLETIFTGYVVRVKPTTPIVIECEDSMWKLKQVEIKDVAQNETLKSFLQRNISEIYIDCFDVKLPSYIANTTATLLLDNLKRDFGFYSFIRNSELVVGKQYDSDNNKEHTCTLHYDVAEDDLEYRTVDELKFAVKAISNLETGEKIEVELGESGGESRTLNFYNLSKSDLEKIAQKEISRLYYDGFRGSFTYFGWKLISHGDIVNIKDAISSDKKGRYYVDSVQYEYGEGGIRQKVELGPLVQS